MRLFQAQTPLAGLLIGFSLLGQGAALVDKWTPEGFDWSGPPHMRSPDAPTGLWMNGSNIPSTTDVAIFKANNHTTTDIGVHQFFAIVPFLGIAWRVANIAAAGIALKNTINTCKQTAGGTNSAYKCAEGVFTTALAFGGAYSAAKKLGGQAGRYLFPHRFLPDGTVNLEMNILTRGLDDAAMQSQLLHHDTMKHMLRSLSHADFPEPEFLGYADDDHRLARRDGGLHPLVPTFRFEHFKLGSMEVASRETSNGTFFSLAPKGSSMHLLGRRQQVERMRKMKRDEIYDHELISGGAVEARFDTEASQADPADISADAGQLFSTFEPETECFIHEDFLDTSILDVQMYDQTNHATFGFGSIGIYNSEGDADSIETMTPTGMPLPTCG